MLELKAKVIIGISGVSSVVEVEDAVAKAFPNPFTSSLHIDRGNAEGFTITDIQGRVLHHAEWSVGVSTINTSAWQSGMYFLNTGTSLQKLIKQ